jgi:Arylsulfotransferase (ASST)
MVWNRDQGTVSTLASLFELLDPKVDRTPASDAKQGLYWKGCDISHSTPSDDVVEDWTHANSIWVGQEGNILVSIRHLNQIIFIAPDFKSIQWRLGGLAVILASLTPTTNFIISIPLVGCLMGTYCYSTTVIHVLQRRGACTLELSTGTGLHHHGSSQSLGVPT